MTAIYFKDYHGMRKIQEDRSGTAVEWDKDKKAMSREMPASCELFQENIEIYETSTLLSDCPSPLFWGDFWKPNWHVKCPNRVNYK